METLNAADGRKDPLDGKNFNIGKISSQGHLSRIIIRINIFIGVMARDDVKVQRLYGSWPEMFSQHR